MPVDLLSLSIIQFSDSGADISLSASSISFLRNNGMDFGTWISKGVPYSDKTREVFLRKKYLDVAPAPAAVNDTIRMVLTKQTDIDFLNRNRINLDSFLADDKSTAFTFEKCNPYLRRALYQLMEFDYPSLTVRKNAMELLEVLKLSEEARSTLLAKAIEDGKRSFNELMGFRLVFLDMISAKKPLVGHNCLFDFMFMMRWLDSPFLEGKMETLSDFKIRFNDYFPVTFDTKYIAECGMMGDEVYTDTSLGALYENTVSSVTKGTTLLQYAPGFDDYYSHGGQFHDAGWDAYCTGALFYHQLKTQSSMAELTKLTGNKLFMMQSLFHIDIDPLQPNGFIKVKGALLHLGNFDKDTKMDAILNIFIAAGYVLSSLSATWIDGTSTFMVVNTSDSPAEVILKVSLPDGWLLRTYEEFTVPQQIVTPDIESTENPLKRTIATMELTE